MSAQFLHQITGSFSQPSGENPTVAMVEAAYRHHGLPWRYINCDVAPADLAAAVSGARAMGWVGFNCSMPHKVAVIQHLDGLAPSAQIIGAVNTVVRNAAGKWIGENTDGKGFVQALREVIDLPGKTALILGAGGAARAVAVELALAGVTRIDVVNRSATQGESLVSLINERTSAQAHFRAWDAVLQIPPGTGVLVNTTSVGLGAPDDELSIDWGSLHAGIVVADAIPNPPRTHLVRTAKAKGCITIDGLGILVNQGAIAFRLWTGVEANRGVMRWALERVLGLAG
ncbi:shikimate dehydrogenase [Hydrogenophaga crassostreae]|uniref:Shikimate dehydrogenase (NADP(+)) n=1 Tax=Hydrogenophaga crassostreae TaxID=1763535 RepID=A0A167HB84_9BURK|nr:shikimate dehydrogenase [Hydrogenophaga crassostreae]AOW15438.1 shikimate dehydrogenase [Hydrogenophaga crassostreae]OAD40642.1 shikimate dehydrogenase [Hydrogenophaga crassostreae]